MSEGASISLKVIEEVAAREGVDPVELQPPLHTAVDPEALDAVFESTSSTTRAAGSIEFHYQGYEIRVDSSGEVQVGETISFAESTDSYSQTAEDSLGD